MQHCHAFECLDRSLRDLMKVVYPKHYHIPFGGITVVLGGDFRQILPVIPYGDRADIVSANITRSRLWAACKVFILKHNMRLSKGNSDERNEVLSIFARWLLDIGEGQNYISKDEGPSCTEFEVQIPPQFCNVEQSNSVEKMMAAIYPNFLTNFKFPEYLSERAKAWDAIKIVTLCADKVKAAHTQTLKGEFEYLKMRETDQLDDVYMKLNNFVTNIRILGEKIEEAYVVKQLLRPIPSKFLQISSSIEQFGNLEEISVQEVIGSLKAYEERLRGSTESMQG
ncbi:uncharacterized protein LOC141718724 [Apium graveolens]|uniref:uncharacterized protein LOC141718724 n=1 Tax=Apium graveolens TaxID=4045 RepID=UPI003D7BA895